MRSETSSQLTSRPTAFNASQRRFGSALVRRKVVSPSRLMVPSSTTLPCASHHGVYITCPIAHLVTSRVTIRSRSRAACGPRMRYFLSGDTSNSAALLRTAAYSRSGRLVGARHLVASPTSPSLRLDERGGARMEWSGLEHPGEETGASAIHRSSFRLSPPPWRPP